MVEEREGNGQPAAGGACGVLGRSERRPWNREGQAGRWTAGASSAGGLRSASIRSTRSTIRMSTLCGGSSDQGQITRTPHGHVRGINAWLRWPSSARYLASCPILRSMCAAIKLMGLTGALAAAALRALLRKTDGEAQT